MAGKIIINMNNIDPEELLENLDDDEDKSKSFSKNLFFSKAGGTTSINETQLKAAAIDSNENKNTNLKINKNFQNKAKMLQS
jgi:hypothetical protein